MFCIQIADIRVAIENEYDYVKLLCKDYVIPTSENVDMTVQVSKEEILREMETAEIQITPAYAEGVCVYRTICRRLPIQFQSFLMHCAVIEYEGNGYAFAAKSGTGKSTHIALWQRRFGDSVRIVNGDKPIMRFVDDRLRAYGTPWCGKEGYNINTSVPLAAICFLERAPVNSIQKIKADEAVMRIFHQLLSPEDMETVDALFPLLDRMLREVPCYVLSCNISEEAAEVAFRGMNPQSKV